MPSWTITIPPIKPMHKIRPVTPVTAMPLKRYRQKATRKYRKEPKITAQPTLIDKIRGLLDWVVMISPASLSCFLRVYEDLPELRSEWSMSITADLKPIHF